MSHDPKAGCAMLLIAGLVAIAFWTAVIVWALGAIQ